MTVFEPDLARVNVQVPVSVTRYIIDRICSVDPFCAAAVMTDSTLFLVLPSTVCGDEGWSLPLEPVFVSEDELAGSVGF